MLEELRQSDEKLNYPPKKLALLMFLFGGVEAKYMDNAIDELEKCYGSVDEYITDVLGLGKAEIEELQKKSEAKDRIIGMVNRSMQTSDEDKIFEGH